jgi:hypothetical protein
MRANAARLRLPDAAPSRAGPGESDARPRQARCRPSGGTAGPGRQSRRGTEGRHRATPVFFGPASKPRLKAAAHWDHRTRAYCSCVLNSAAYLASAIALRGVPKGASLQGIAYNLPSCGARPAVPKRNGEGLCRVGQWGEARVDVSARYAEIKAGRGSKSHGGAAGSLYNEGAEAKGGNRTIKW